jgi:hypothetical protein
MLELQVRHVRMPLHDALPAVVLLSPRDWPDARVLRVPIGAADAHALLSELRGAPACGRAGSPGGLLSGTLSRGLVVRLVPAAGVAERALEPAGGIVDVPMEPGQALAAAVRLGIPVLGDPRLFSDESVEPAGVAAFLESHEIDLCR